MVVAESVRVEDFRVGVTVWVFGKGREVGEENCFGGDVMRIVGDGTVEQWGIPLKGEG